MANPYHIPCGVFSRLYHLAPEQEVAVAYNTVARSVALLEGEAACVWHHLYEGRGNPDRALRFIAESNISPQEAPGAESDMLDEFLCELESAGLVSICGRSSRPPLVGTHKGDHEGRQTEREIAALMSENHVMHNLVVELTYDCNERCVHCYCPALRRRSELAVESLMEMISEFEELGGFSLQLTGGEILSRRSTKTVLSRLQGRNLVVSIISNLTLLDSESLELIAGLYPRSVGCSIYSALPDVHDTVTRMPGSFDKSVASILALRKRDVPVVIKTPLMRDTVAGWRKVEALAESLGCTVQFDLNITARNDGGLSPTDLRVHDEAEIRELFETRFDRLHQQGEPLGISQTGPGEDAALCGAGATGLCVSPDGMISPCIGLPIRLGQWPADSLRDIWQNSVFLKEWEQRRLKDIPQCRACHHVSTCFRCPGSWYVEHGDFTRPNEYTCYLARVAAASMLSTKANASVNKELQL
jgi:radical SAM protein with 4Fe4S-binding SPASM domain